jgi:peptidoglycan/xylan/chitin deacetylase (PgdA/CDA1 family)
LSQVYGFVKQSRGHVKIHNKGIGTTVKVRLPRYAKPTDLGDQPDSLRASESPTRGCGWWKLAADVDVLPLGNPFRDIASWRFAGAHADRRGVRASVPRMTMVNDMRTAIFVLAAAVCAGVAADPVHAADCAKNPDALGTSRVIVVDPKEHPGIGTMQYKETLPLNDHEVVLSFDDGPLPRRTSRILDELAAECVEANFFIIGSMAAQFPRLVRRAYAEGHTIGTHTQNHPLNLRRLPPDKAHKEIDDGIASTGSALGDVKEVSPFVRLPGLGTSAAIEDYIASEGMMIWSTDFVADDWRHISAKQVLARALQRLEKKGKGILLLHDIQPATVAALPLLLKELKRRHYAIVHVIAAAPDHPRTETTPEQWLSHPPKPHAEAPGEPGSRHANVASRPVDGGPANAVP